MLGRSVLQWTHATTLFAQIRTCGGFDCRCIARTASNLHVVSAVQERSGYVAHFFSPAAQLTISVISAVEGAVLTRKRWPSADMSQNHLTPARRGLKSAVAVPLFTRTPSLVTFTAINLPSRPKERLAGCSAGEIDGMPVMRPCPPSSTAGRRSPRRSVDR